MATHSVVLPGESQGWGSLVGCRLWGRTESDTTEVTQQQHDLAIPLLGIHTGETRIERDPNVHRSTVYNSQDMEAT